MMPWFALPYDQVDIKMSLKKLCGINGIPHLMICSVKEGTILQEDASELLQEDPEKLYEYWLKKLNPLSVLTESVKSE